MKINNLLIEGYSEIVKIYESNLSVTYKAKDKNQKFFIIKVLKDEYPDLETIEKFQNEYELTKEIDSPYIRKSFKVMQINGRHILFADYVDAETLNEYVKRKKISFQSVEFLKLSIQVVQAIDAIHSCQIIHKDINGNNIMYQENQNQIIVIDFGISSKFITKSNHLGNPDKLEGTLSYISPEQTGRMNRYIDHRSDLYSLGVTLYELFTNVLPFLNDDPMELIHSHIAVIPESPYSIYSKLYNLDKISKKEKFTVKLISDIIMKLLFKNAEERYQSTFGLKYDMEYCLQMFQNDNVDEILNFKLGSFDFSQKLQIPQKLYGREREVIELFKSYDKVCNGKKEITIVHGFSGIGKTVLVQEIFKALKMTGSVKSYFTSGKFDQLNKNIPYFAWSMAFKNLINLILTENEVSLNYWKSKLSKEIGNIGKCLIEVIPNLELLMGNLSDISELHGLESENRFNYAFKNFIRAICSEEHPIVIFIDDLQWIDLASLKLLKMVLMDADLKYLYFIGAYRINEVSSTHPFVMTLDEITNLDIEFRELEIKNLTHGNILALLKDTFSTNESDYLVELSQIIYDKTQGNAFFINQFIQNLYEDHLIQFSYKEKQWIWNIEDIQNKNITDNVVELVSSKVLKLPNATIELLKFASCIGNTFDVELLSYISETEILNIRRNLEIALIEQIIYIVDSQHYKFLHDKVQQAVYVLISEDIRKPVHLQVGRKLLDRIPKEKYKEQVFEIVNHLNIGVELVSSIIEKDSIVQLNILAGQKAKSSIAYSTALNYYKQALNMFSETKWTTNYDITLFLNNEIAEVSYLSTNFDIVKDVFADISKYAKNPIDKVEIYNTMILAEVACANFKTCLELGIQILKMLGLSIPDKPKQFHVIMLLLQVELRLRNVSFEKIYNQKKMTDPNKLALIKILQTLNVPAYFAGKELVPIFALNQVLILHKYGNIPESVYSYLAYAFIVNNVLDDIERGNRLAKMILQLIDEWNPESVKSRTILPLDVFVRHWKEPLRESYSRFLDGFKLAQETGDLETACNYLLMHAAYNYYAGVPLNQVQDLIVKALKPIREYKRDRSIYYLITLQQIIASLTGESNNYFEFTGKFCNEKQMLDVFQRTNDLTSIGFLWYNKAFVYFHREQYIEALDYIKSAEQYLESLMGVPDSALILFYNALIRLQIYNQSSSSEKKQHIKIIKSAYKKFKKWTKSSPKNFQHRAVFLDAELHRINGKMLEAKSLYDKAIDLANQNEYLQEEGLFYEFTAKFCHSQNMDRLTRYYIEGAHKCYKQWGFFTKCIFLEQIYPSLTSITKQNSDKTMNSTISSTKTSIHQILDLNSVIKASQTLASEINLETLLYKLIRIVIENSGAQKGLLILPQENKWYIEAKATTQSKDMSILQSIAVDLENDISIPTKVVQYVMRTKESIVLNNAFQEENYMSDTYILSNKIKSILCMPLLNQNNLVGILYLENNLAFGVFTSERLEILKILSSQMGISIENARLYDQTTKLNKAYERFVPSQFLELLDKKSIIDVQLGDQVQKEMTILFSDIRFFTNLSEKMTPEENFKFINSYLSVMEPVIGKHNGFIDKYIGDAIMALFPKSADDAVSGSIEILKKLTEFNEYRKKNNQTPIDIGIGLNTGLLMMGTVGGMNRMDGTVISDAVNLASRIENQTKIYKSKLLISEFTYYKLSNPKDFLIRFVDRVRVKGKTKSVSIFEVYDTDDPIDKEGKIRTQAIMEKALTNFFFLKLEKAKDLFGQCLDIYPKDKLTEMYMTRCNEMLAVGDPDLDTFIEENISWFDDYQINVQQIDEQHKELFGRMKNLITCIINDSSPQELRSAIRFLENYTITHFADEEELMRSIDYPLYEFHKKEHEFFIKEIEYLKVIEQKGNSLHIILRLKNYIGEWMINHILKVDRQLGNFIQSKI